jgi:hypothetical protein
MKILDKIKSNLKEKSKKIKEVLKPNDKYKIEWIKQGKEKLISINKDNKPLIKASYNFFGIYQPKTKLFIWASSIPGISQDQIKYIRWIKSHEHLFESDNDIKVTFYYQLLTQDVVQITDERMIQWINELLLYLSQDLYIFNPLNSDDNIQFISISEIKEKFS